MTSGSLTPGQKNRQCAGYVEMCQAPESYHKNILQASA